MNGSHVLAIDQGTTGTKTVVVAGDGHVTGSASTEFTQHFPRPGWVEHDPEEIWRSVLATAEEALGRARVRPAESDAGLSPVASLSCCRLRGSSKNSDDRSAERLSRRKSWTVQRLRSR